MHKLICVYLQRKVTADIRRDGVLIGMYLPAVAPTTEITVAVPATSGDSIGVAIAVTIPMPAMTPEDAIAKAYPAVRSTSVPTTITSVVTIDKLSALLIEL